MSTGVPVKVAVTDVADQICYSLLFRIASGSLLGDRPIELCLLEITPALRALEGATMELDNRTFPNLKNVVIGDDPKKVFNGVNLAMLVGAIPRKTGIERGDLLSINGAIFTAQDKVLNEVVADDVHVLVIGNPTSTNALIASSSAPDIPGKHSNAPIHLDHNRTRPQLAQRLGYPVEGAKRMTIWGNHSSIQYPDVFHTGMGEKNAAGLVSDEVWVGSTFILTVTKRDAAIIEAHGLSPVASVANVTVEHMRGWVLGIPDGDWVSMAVLSDGPYGIAESVVSSFPRVVKNDKYEIVQGFEIDPFSHIKIDASVAELLGERRAVKELGLI